MASFLNIGDLPLRSTAEFLDVRSLLSFARTCKAAHRVCSAEIKARDERSKIKSTAVTAAERVARIFLCQEAADWIENEELHPGGHPKLRPTFYFDADYFVRISSLIDENDTWEAILPSDHESPLPKYFEENNYHDALDQLFSFESDYVDMSSTIVSLDFLQSQNPLPASLYSLMTTHAQEDDEEAVCRVTVVRILPEKGILRAKPVFTSTIGDAENAVEPSESPKMDCLCFENRDIYPQNDEDESFVTAFVMHDKVGRKLRNLTVLGAFDSNHGEDYDSEGEIHSPSGFW